MKIIRNGTIANQTDISLKKGIQTVLVSSYIESFFSYIDISNY